jgi:hypothetical protein
MNVDLRFPNINATTPEGQMAQMQSYMHQLVQQLNWALNSLDEAVAGNTSSVVISKPKEALTPEEAVNTFNSIKSLIIKSADIVKAYEETIKTDFNGEYFADSDFGTYLEQTNRYIEENSKGVTEIYTKVETITNKDGNGTLDVLNKDVNDTNGYIRRGELGTYKTGELKGKTAFGIGVGETTNGEYKSYAWFTPNRLSFFDGEFEVAYISSNKLYIENAVFLGTVQFGKYKLDTSDGLAFTWIGGE